MSGLLFVSYSGILGGAERVLLDCATAVRGPAVLACPAGELAERARAAGVTPLILTSRPLELRASGRARGRAAAALAAHAWDVRRLVRSVDPDVVVAWGMRSALGALVSARGRPFVVAHHDFLPGRLIASAVRTTAARADSVLVPSRAVADDLDPRGRLRRRMHVLTPGVDPARYADTGDPVTPPEVLVLGALAEWKRPDLALEIVARARRRVPGLRLRFVGGPLADDDSVERTLDARAHAADLAGGVELAGRRVDPRGDLARASCLLHCAPREPFGIVLLEAMASGRPVIAPDAAGPREIVEPECGWLYPPGDADAGAGALIELLTEPERARRAGDAGRQVVRRRFDRTQTQAGFIRALDPVLERVTATARRPTSAARRTPGALTLVTVTHDSQAPLVTLLDSVARHLPSSPVIVVDCDSEDDSVAVARRRPDVEVVALGENLGFGRACNRGLEHVRTPVTALVNPDVELLDDSLLELADEALRDDRPERLLAPRVLNRDGGLQDTVHPLPASAADLVRALVPPAALPGRAGVWLAPWRTGHPRRVGWAVGCALVARTETLRTLGPFPDSVFMYGEDLELGLHARQRGVETWLWPSAQVIHERAHASARRFGGEAFERLARGRHEAVRRRLGPERAALDDAAQTLTFASRWAMKRALGMPAVREWRQLAAIASIRGKATR